jgi:hypothetical protein
MASLPEYPQPTSTGAPSAVVEIYEKSGMSATELMNLWWRQRIKFLLLAAAGALVAMAIVVGLYVFRPVTQESSIVFRLLFKGAEKGTYPNGLRFTPADIVATPVLEEVYRRNHLEKFLPFDQFKSTFSVINRNPSLDRLRREYAGLLDDRKLAPVDRQRLEDEYESKTRAMANGEFTLVALSSGRASEWPADLSGKVMEDILNVWADQSRSRGVFLFDLAIYSENILDELQPERVDYTILVDRIRLTVNRVLGNLHELSAIPGSQLVRVGEKQTSLGEIESSLRDYLDFDIKEIGSYINNFSLFRDRRTSESYLREQLFRLELSSKELQSRNEGIQRILSDYNTQGRTGSSTADNRSSTGAVANGVSPQLSDTFLDKIMTLSGQNADVTFRQDLSRQMIENERRMVDISTDRQLYQRSIDALSRGESAVAGAKEASVVVDHKITELLQRIRVAVRNVDLLHRELSQQSLQPSKIYSIVQPLHQQNLSPVGIRLAVLAVGFCYAIFLCGILLWLAWWQPNPRR